MQTITNADLFSEVTKIRGDVLAIKEVDDHDESEDDNATVIVHYILFIVRTSTLRRMLRVTYICYCYMIMFYVGLALMPARALLVNLNVFVR